MMLAAGLTKKTTEDQLKDIYVIDEIFGQLEYPVPFPLKNPIGLHPNHLNDSSRGASEHRKLFIETSDNRQGAGDVKIAWLRLHNK